MHIFHYLGRPKPTVRKDGTVDPISGDDSDSANGNSDDGSGGAPTGGTGDGPGGGGDGLDDDSSAVDTLDDLLG